MGSYYFYETTESKLKSYEKYLQKVEERYMKALENTLEAETPWGDEYVFVFGDDWVEELTEDERLGIIEHDYEQEFEEIRQKISDLEDELEEERRAEEAGKIYDEISEKLVESITRKLEKFGYEVDVHRARTTLSIYIDGELIKEGMSWEDIKQLPIPYSLTIRISDHPQPPFGGVVYHDEALGPVTGGDADIDIVIDVENQTYDVDIRNDKSGNLWDLMDV